MTNIFKIQGRKNIVALIISILIAELTGYLSYVLSGNMNNVIMNLQKPKFLPPSWIFPIVWTILYALMGIAAYRIWMIGKRGINVKNALILYGIQLVLNFLWSIIFFKFKLIGVGFLEIVILLGFIIFNTLEFKKYDKISACLMMPYMIWVAFAVVLNYFFLILNS